MVVTVLFVGALMTVLDFNTYGLRLLMIGLAGMTRITPSVGLSIYVVQSARREGQLGGVMIGKTPYVLLVMISLLIVFAGLGLYLPENLSFYKGLNTYHYD